MKKKREMHQNRLLAVIVAALLIFDWLVGTGAIRSAQEKSALETQVAQLNTAVATLSAPPTPTPEPTAMPTLNPNQSRYITGWAIGAAVTGLFDDWLFRNQLTLVKEGLRISLYDDFSDGYDYFSNAPVRKPVEFQFGGIVITPTLVLDPARQWGDYYILYLQLADGSCAHTPWWQVKHQGFWGDTQIYYQDLRLVRLASGPVMAECPTRDSLQWYPVERPPLNVQTIALTQDNAQQYLEEIGAMEDGEMELLPHITWQQFLAPAHAPQKVDFSFSFALSQYQPEFSTYWYWAHEDEGCWLQPIGKFSRAYINELGYLTVRLKSYTFPGNIPTWFERCPLGAVILNGGQTY